MTLEKQHILVIRLSAMGDVAMTVSVLSALEKQYPHVKVTVLTRSFFRPIFLGLNNVFIYEVDVKGRHKGLYGLWKLYKELKKLNIDVVADLHNVLRSNILKMYFKLSAIPFVQIDKGRAEKKALTAVKGKQFHQLKTTHQRYADVFAKIGMPLDLQTNNVLPKRTITLAIKKLIHEKDKPWVGIAPFAAFEGKMYPLDLMESVVEKLHETQKYKILFFGGGESEKQILDGWSKKFINSNNLIGKLTFEEELTVISQLDVMLAMDSGNAHLASLFAVPTITLWGVTHPYAGFYPFGQPKENALLADRNQFPLLPTSVYGNKYPAGYENAMRTILPENITLKIEDIISKKV